MLGDFLYNGNVPKHGQYSQFSTTHTSKRLTHMEINFHQKMIPFVNRKTVKVPLPVSIESTYTLNRIFALAKVDKDSKGNVSTPY